MAPVGCNLGERLKHESTLMKPRVWQNKRGSVRHLALIIEEIEIEHARCVSLAADTTELFLDRLQSREQVSRGEMGCQRSYRINKPRLVRARHRLSSVPGGVGDNPDTLRLECHQGGRERIGR